MAVFASILSHSQPELREGMNSLNVTDLHISSCPTVTLRLDGSVYESISVCSA